jgi:hypothetical protein
MNLYQMKIAIAGAGEGPSVIRTLVLIAISAIPGMFLLMESLKDHAG